MAARQGKHKLLAPSTPQGAEMARQRAEGIARAQLEVTEETSLQEEAKYGLHHLKAQAVTTLQMAMLNTGVCPNCRASGLVVDKTAVTAALGILDRAGLPPAKNVNVNETKVRETEGDIRKRAVMALLELDAEDLGFIVGGIVKERPDARPYIEAALAGQLVIQA